MKRAKLGEWNELGRRTRGGEGGTGENKVHKYNLFLPVL